MAPTNEKKSNTDPDEDIPLEKNVMGDVEARETAWASRTEEAAEGQTTETGKSRQRFTISLRVGLTCIILLVVVVTSAIVYIPWIFLSKSNIANIVTELNREIIKGVSLEINNIFTDATNTLNTIESILSQKVVDIENPQQRKMLFLSLLKSNPTFSWISFGWPNGDFIGAQRQDTLNIRFHDSKWNEREKMAVRQIDFYALEGNKLRFTVQRVLERAYYAPQREWFKAAVNGNGVAWTKVYIFSTSKQPGINAALSFDTGQIFIGVITIAIELERISVFLKSFDVAKNGTVFLMNPRKELIAFQDPEEVTHTLVGSEKPQLKRLNEAKDPRLVLAHEALVSNAVNTRELFMMKQFSYKDKKTGKLYFVSFGPIAHQDWIVGTVIPESDFLQEINKRTRYLLIGVVLLILIAAFSATLLSKYLIVNPLTKITRQTRHIRDFHLDQIAYEPSFIREVDQLSSAMEQMRRGLSSFQKYVPTELVRTLISQGVEAKLGGSEKQLTILFSDLVNFTKIAEGMKTRDLVLHLSDYLEEMSNLITKDNGTIDKYIGDAIMAFWGAPNPNRRHTTDACRAALKCQRELNALRTRWTREGKPPFFSRIGINTGPVVVGNLGSIGKMNYTVIGDSVNLASRLESLNKLYRTEILIGRETYEQAKQDIIARKIDNVVVYGREAALEIYELLSMRDDVRIVENYEWIDRYEEGLSLFYRSKFTEAIRLFERAISIRENDPPSTVFLKRCKKYLDNAPDAKLSGMTVMRSK